jgi:hypothetical protein
MVAGKRRFVLQHLKLAYGLVGGDEDVIDDFGSLIIRALEAVKGGNFGVVSISDTPC